MPFEAFQKNCVQYVNQISGSEYVSFCAAGIRPYFDRRVAVAGS
jgi:hypothetical protein